MPELPEVQTTVDGLNKIVRGLTIQDVWSDLPSTKVSRNEYKESIKYLPFFKRFKENILNQKILKAERRAKNILIHLSGGHTILIHMKMTGHLLYGKYENRGAHWIPHEKEKNDALRDPFNKWIHLVFSLSNGKHLVLSDLRKFAKVTLLKDGHLDDFGPEPLDEAFTLKLFKERVLKRPNGKIKPVLMDQKLISGIGNIYSDEALWLSDIHPLSVISKIPDKELKKLHTSIKKVLSKGIDFGGDSTSDYRQLDGKPGTFNHAHNAYRLTGKKCMKRGCPGGILRTVVSGRSAHFCDTHQKLYA